VVRQLTIPLLDGPEAAVGGRATDREPRELRPLVRRAGERREVAVRLGVKRLDRLVVLLDRCACRGDGRGVLHALLLRGSLRRVERRLILAKLIRRRLDLVVEERLSARVVEREGDLLAGGGRSDRVDGTEREHVNELAA